MIPALFTKSLFFNPFRREKGRNDRIVLFFPQRFSIDSVKFIINRILCQRNINNAKAENVHD